MGSLSYCGRIWLALTMAGWLAGCGRGPGDPLGVSRSFLKAWQAGDRRAAARWVHPDGRRQFEVSFEASDVTIRSFRLGRVEIRGADAWVRYASLDATIGGKAGCLPAWVSLRKHEGEWRVLAAGDDGPPKAVRSP